MIIAILLVITGITGYTMLYGYRVGRQGNRFGALGIFLLSLAAAGVPIYLLFFRR